MTPVTLPTIDGVVLRWDRGAIHWESGMAVDADGSPRAYAPPPRRGLDTLGNAGRGGVWWGIVVDRKGQPVIADNGYYVSHTSLFDSRFPIADQRRYVNAEVIPYVAVPKDFLDLGVRPGDLAYVTYKGKATPAIVADIGKRGAIGEGSIALAKALDINDSPRKGGVINGVEWWVWPGTRTRPAWPRPNFREEAEANFNPLVV